MADVQVIIGDRIGGHFLRFCSFEWNNFISFGRASNSHLVGLIVE